MTMSKVAGVLGFVVSPVSTIVKDADGIKELINGVLLSIHDCVSVQ
jgi:hypothetical protein